MVNKQHICSNCRKQLANRHSLSRHKKKCPSSATQSNFDGKKENQSTTNSGDAAARYPVDVSVKDSLDDSKFSLDTLNPS